MALAMETAKVRWEQDCPCAPGGTDWDMVLFWAPVHPESVIEARILLEAGHPIVSPHCTTCGKAWRVAGVRP